MIDDLRFTGMNDFIISTGATLDREIIKTSEIMKKIILTLLFTVFLFIQHLERCKLE